MTTKLEVRIAMGIAAACVTATALYAVLRVVQFFLFPDPNPALVIWSAHAGYFWRCWTVGYAGGMVGLGAFAASGKYGAKVAQALAVGVTVATVLLLAQGLFVP